MQATTKDSLSISLYFTIASIALELTLLEMIKIILRQRSEEIKFQENVKKNYSKLLERKIAAFNPYLSLKAVVDSCKFEKEKLPDNTVLEKQKKTQKMLTKITNILSVFQMIFCCVQIIITPLKLVPYNSTTMRIINVETLLSFAFVFISYFCSSFDFKRKQDSEMIDIETNTANYYLTVIEIMNDDKERESKNQSI